MPVWPPPSPPCAMHRVDAPRRDLLGVALGADRRHRRRTPRVLQLLDQLARSGAWAKLATFTPLADQQRRCGRRRRAGRRAGSRRTGLSVRVLHLVRSRSRSSVEVHRGRWRGCRARRPSAVAAVRRGAGDPAHAGLHDRVLDAEQVADARCAARRASRGSALPRSRRPVRVDHLADQRAAPRRSARGVSGTSSAIDELEAGGRDDLVDGHAGVHRAQAHAVVGRLEVEHAEVGDDAADLVEARRRRRRARRRGRSRRRDTTSTCSHEHLRRVVRDPVARGVVDRVARRAAEAEQLRLRLVPVADEREVLVAEPVDLAARPSSRGAGPTTRRRTSCGTGSTPRRPSSRRSTPTGHGVGDEQRLAVGHHEVGLERRPGEPAADHRDRADRVGEDLAVAAEALGARDHATRRG